MEVWRREWRNVRIFSKWDEQFALACNTNDQCDTSEDCKRGCCQPSISPVTVPGGTCLECNTNGQCLTTQDCRRGCCQWIWDEEIMVEFGVVWDQFYDFFYLSFLLFYKLNKISKDFFQKFLRVVFSKRRFWPFLKLLVDKNWVFFSDSPLNSVWKSGMTYFFLDHLSGF